VRWLGGARPRTGVRKIVVAPRGQRAAKTAPGCQCAGSRRTHRARCACAAPGWSAGRSAGRSKGKRNIARQAAARAGKHRRTRDAFWSRGAKTRRAERRGRARRDGEQHNLTWNCGAEGPTRSPRVLRLRARQQRNLAAALLLAQGVPMVLMGDEYGHSKARSRARANRALRGWWRPGCPMVHTGHVLVTVDMTAPFCACGFRRSGLTCAGAWYVVWSQVPARAGSGVTQHARSHVALLLLHGD